MIVRESVYIKYHVLVAITIIAVFGIVLSAHYGQMAVQILGFASFMCIQLLGILQGAMAAKKVEQVHADLKVENVKVNAQLSSIAATGEVVHALVNERLEKAMRKIEELKLEVRSLQKGETK